MMFMNNKKFNAITICLSFLTLSALFISFPEIDIYVSSLFYKNGFILKGSLFEIFFYKSVPIVITIFATGSILVFLYNFINKKNILNINKRVIIYIILVLALAPGGIVNSLLKEHWGRARPNQIIKFGGDKKFTPAFILSDQGGNSFSCGHGAAAFSLLGFALLATKRKRLWITLALSYGVLVSFARIIGGGHFISDTVTSFFIVYITTDILYYFIIKKQI